MDYRKTLDQLNVEWSTCSACPLGNHRETMGTCFVGGNGATGGLYLLGGSVTRTEANSGMPFSGEAGALVGRMLHQLKFTGNDIYASHVTPCRACEPSVDGEGHAVMRTNKMTGALEQIWRDSPPTPTMLNTCKARVLEEIYLVDPVLIVALGELPTKQLLGTNFPYTTNIGSIQPLEFEGAGVVAAVTPKQLRWARRVNGQLVYPVKPNKVEYRVLVTTDPLEVLRKWVDMGHDNPMKKLLGQLHEARRVLLRYRQEVYNVMSLEPVNLAAIEAALRVKEAENVR